MSNPPLPTIIPPPSDSDAPASKLTLAILLLLLMVLCLLVRLDGWMTLPIFGDEAIYLRWTQLIKTNFWQHAFVSLVDPKPPLHYWLMAAAWTWMQNKAGGADPLSAGRLVSVLVAVLMVPLVLALAVSLKGLARREVPHAQMSRREFLAAPLPAPSGRVVGLLASLFFILCPFLAFYQRMALADGLFAVESIAAAWLAVRLAVAARAETVPLARGLCTQALPFALIMALSMLTRQIVSYELWALPIAAFLLIPWHGRPAHVPTQPPSVPPNYPQPNPWQRFALWLAAALLLAAVLWSPFLLAQPDRYRSSEGTGPVTRESFGTELRRRVLYQPQFTEKLSVHERLTRIEKNFLTVFVPGVWAADGRFQPQPWTDQTHPELDTGWYWLYLTPPVLLLGLLGWLWLALRRQWRLLIFLALWLFLMVGPLILVGSVAFSRYTLAGVVPWLIVVAYLLGDIVAWLSSERGLAAVGWVGATITALLVGGTLVWPAYAIHLQNDRWPQQQLVRRDQYQYITGWTAGQASQEAVNYLKALPPGPLVIITGAGWGTPADAIWVYMQDRPMTWLYYIEGDKAGSLRPTGAAPDAEKTLWSGLHENKYLYQPARLVAIRREVPVLYLCPDPVHTPTADIPGRDMIRRLNPQALELGNFSNPAAGESVIIFRLQ